MKLGINGQSLGVILDFEGTLDFLNELEINAIEIWPRNLPMLEGCAFSDDYENRDIEKALKLLREKKIEVAAVSYAAAFSRNVAENDALYSKGLAKAVETAHLLGASIVNHYCYFLSLEALDIDKLKRCMTPALELAKKYSITMVLENEAHDMTKTPTDMKRIVEAFGDANFKTNYDAVNYYEAGVEGYPYAYDILKDVIGYVHFKNGSRLTADSKKTITYTSIEDGGVNIIGLMSRLEKDGYNGYCTVEPHCPPVEVMDYLRKDISWLKNHK